MSPAPFNYSVNAAIDVGSHGSITHTELLINVALFLLFFFFYEINIVFFFLFYVYIEFD